MSWFQAAWVGSDLALAGVPAGGSGNTWQPPRVGSGSAAEDGATATVTAIATSARTSVPCFKGAVSSSIQKDRMSAHTSQRGRTEVFYWMRRDRMRETAKRQVRKAKATRNANL